VAAAANAAGASAMSAAAQQGLLTTLIDTLGIYGTQLEKLKKDREAAVIHRPACLKPTAEDLQDAKRVEAEAHDELNDFLANVIDTQQAREFLEAHRREFSTTAFAAEAEPAEGAEAEPAAGQVRQMTKAEFTRFDDLLDRRKEAQRVSGVKQQQDIDWRLYEQSVEVINHIDKAVSGAVARVSNINQEIATIHQAASASATAPAAAAAAPAPRVALISGFLHPDLGMVISPNLAIYYVVRAVLEGAYVPFGVPDEHLYMELRRDRSMSLAAWGSKIRMYAKCLPNVPERAHRAIYLRGLLDDDLQAKVRAFRQYNPGT